MRKLYYTTGSPFARAVRIVLAEKVVAVMRKPALGSSKTEMRAPVWSRNE
jgi:hypothetical protein